MQRAVLAVQRRQMPLAGAASARQQQACALRRPACGGRAARRAPRLAPPRTAQVDLAGTGAANAGAAGAAAAVAAPPARAQPLGQPGEQQQPAGAGSFPWTKHWWPIAPLSYLDPKKPAPVTLLGHTYVIWWDSKAGQYRLMEDRCPHRLAPLSEGRLNEHGNLECAYHGWAFEGSGSCTRIPQIGDPERAAAACASGRACVSSFPTTVVDGVLFGWLESGPEAEAEAAASRPYNMPELSGSETWHMTEPPTDFTFWLEQGMDPTHANFLHHTCGFPMSDALAMPGEALPPGEVDLQGGYTWRHGNYSAKHKGMQAERQFVPPNSLRVVYDKGFVRGFATMGVPVRPGLSRVFGRFSFGAPGAKAPLLFRLLGKLPHWARVPSPLADQDTVVNAKQEQLMRSLGLTPRDYAAFARADQGVLAAHRWFDAAGYEEMWRQRLGAAYDAEQQQQQQQQGEQEEEQPAASSAAAAAAAGDGARGARYAFKPYSPPVSDAEYFSWWDRHTKHCKECLRGMALVGRAADAAAVAGVLLAVLAASLAAAARTLASPGAIAAAAAAAGCAWLRAKLLEFRHDQFVSSQRRWQRDGGLSLVRGEPIKVDLGDPLAP